MNRSFISVIAGGFGTDGSSTGDDQEVGEHREITAEETAELLKNSHSVIITPGTAWQSRRRNILSLKLPRNCALVVSTCVSVSTRLRAFAWTYERIAG